MQVYVASIGPDLICERMKVAQLLWAANIASEYSHLDNPKFKKQLDETLERAIPYMIVFGSDELERGVVKLKNIIAKAEVEVPRGEIVQALLEQGCCSLSAGVDLSFMQAMKSSIVTIAKEDN